MKSRTSRFASDFASWLGLRPLRSTCRLPKGQSAVPTGFRGLINVSLDVNTVVQCRDMIVMASAVADGSFGGKQSVARLSIPISPHSEQQPDTLGPYNQDGTLVVRVSGKGTLDEIA